MSSKIFCKSWGAEYIAADVVRFRLWATGQQKVMLRLAGKDQEMQASGDGWFTLDVSGVTPGTEYNFVLNDGMVVPDPASRAQKTDVNGPSYVVDPGSYTWRNTGWKGSRWEQAVVYEMHTGTFTPEGTFRAAIAKLPYLAELGVTVIEVMPVAQFGGERGWGYDGVLLYAPHSAYGTPDDFKAFIDAAHGYGLSVVLDIVLNHFGPEGNYLPLLAPAFFHKERMTPWGNGIAYDVDAVRRYIIEAPLYWLTEYHLDGLRFDAIDQIEDSSARHVLVEIAQRIREDITDRPIHLTTEDSRNIISLHPRDQDGNAPLFTAEWNDDFHNAVHVFATGETQAYYNDFADTPEKHLARALAEGFAYQGEISPQTGEPRGVKSTGQPPVAFVDFIQNHEILAKGEQLPDDWPVSGTTGYEFIASLAEVLVDDEQIDNLRQAYETVKGAPVDMRAELRAAKLLMVDRNFEGEFTRLLALALSIASELQIAQEESIVRQALRELLIAFPVYRTYGTAEGLPPTDICLLHRIVERVKTLENPPQPEALTFLSRLLTGDVPASSQEEATQFRVRFQQLTGPLMAKSVEDTLFFRQNMGLALNEVGAEPVTHHFSIERFHHEMKTRQARQPDALSGTSTHDTKRGEDARARLYTLTEAPEQWSECLARWRQMNQTHVKFLNDGTAPKSADTWMLYQALTGVWPPMLQPQDETGLNALKIRFEAFVEKALREAKLRTDWVDSNEAYETAMLDYARYLLAPDNQTFLQDFYRSLQPFIRAGLVNSLTQTVIKLTAPGVPDIYQGSEALNFSLVDPDNRREPDFATLAQQLDQLTPGVFSREESWLNGQVNQYVTAALLRLRQQNHELFRFGDYIPLRAVGQRADKVIAYARVNHDDALIVVAPRLVFAECDGLLSQSHSGFWSGTDIIIPGQLNQHRYRNVLTQERLMPGERLSLASHQGGVLVLMSD
ncbi:malto-oligosyltrehalose synthase [Salmonella enterica subsp. enterica serovar Dublin]|nr:malto-oligosyltrehalose synthase [Salmonella enterica subsp. enterica serovar Dublin]EEK0585302.1 malto-oligosyltrehalose synthase [Salmonella enterica subsp. enterica serovar Dublin]EEK0659080.1 malto-oligosyltrehalose synthase [Salmonella enterica subsp. enterica serovar Dublin]